MKMRFICVLAVLVFSSSVFAKDEAEEIGGVYFHQGVLSASTCHTYYLIESAVFDKRDKVSIDVTSEALKNTLGQRIINDIYSYTGRKDIFLNEKYSECIDKLHSDEVKIKP